MTLFSFVGKFCAGLVVTGVALRVVLVYLASTNITFMEFSVAQALLTILAFVAALALVAHLLPELGVEDPEFAMLRVRVELLEKRVVEDVDV